MLEEKQEPIVNLFQSFRLNMQLGYLIHKERP